MDESPRSKEFAGRKQSDSFLTRKLVEEEYTLVLKLGKYTEGPMLGLGGSACKVRATISLSSDDKIIGKSSKYSYRQTAVSKEDKTRSGAVDFEDTILQVPITPHVVRVADYAKLKLQLSHPSLLNFHMELGRCHIYLASMLEQIKEKTDSDNPVAASGAYVFPVERKKNSYAAAGTHWNETGLSKYGNLCVELFLYYGNVDVMSPSSDADDDDENSDSDDGPEEGAPIFNPPADLDINVLDFHLPCNVRDAAKVFFGTDTEFLNDVFVKRKYHDIVVQPWMGTERSIEYNVTVVRYKVRAYEKQILIEDADQSGCVYTSETRMPQLPSGSSFYTKVQYVYTRKSKARTHLRITAAIIFTSSTLLKGTIMRNTKSQLPDSFDVLRIAYEQKLGNSNLAHEGHGGEDIAGASQTGSGKRDNHNPGSVSDNSTKSDSNNDNSFLSTAVNVLTSESFTGVARVVLTYGYNLVVLFLLTLMVALLIRLEGRLNRLEDIRLQQLEPLSHDEM